MMLNKNGDALRDELNIVLRELVCFVCCTHLFRKINCLKYTFQLLYTTEEPYAQLEAEMKDNLCGVLARFYTKCNNEGFLNNPSVSLYLTVYQTNLVPRASAQKNVVSVVLAS